MINVVVIIIINQLKEDCAQLLSYIHLKSALFQKIDHILSLEEVG